jgi:hypothetical protein
MLDAADAMNRMGSKIYRGKPLKLAAKSFVPEKSIDPSCR